MGFQGSIRGAGDATVLTNPDQPLAVIDDPLWVVPAPGVAWPALLSFVDSDLRVSDLGIHIRGTSPTQGWSVFGFPPIQAFGAAVLVTGSNAQASFARVSIQGELAPADLFGFNLGNGIYFETTGPDLSPLSGSLHVTGSSFTNMASPVPVYGLDGAQVVIAGNVFQDTTLGGEIVDISRTHYAFVGNTATGVSAGVDAYDNCLGGDSVCGMSDSTLQIAGNHINAGGFGIALTPTFSQGMNCRLVGNHITVPTGGTDVFLGNGVTCLTRP